MNKYTSEFTWELLFYIPYVFYRVNNGEQFLTECSKDTDCFYFFKNNHRGNLDRIQNDSQLHKLCSIQNISFNSKYNHSLNPRYFNFPNYKKHFSSFTEISFQKPLIVINNKSNSEWGLKTIQNRIELNELEFLIDKFSEKYQIVYFRPVPKKHVSDDAPEIFWEEKKYLKNKYGNMIILDEELIVKYPHLTYNELQLVAHSKSEKFISIGGGNAILCSLFSGENVIITKCAIGVKRQIWHSNSFLKKISNTKIYGSHNLEDLIQATQGW